MEAGQRVGKQLIKTVHDCHHLIGSICPLRYSPQPCNLVTEISNKDIGQIQKHQLLGIHTACFCFQIFRDSLQVFGYAFNDVTQRLCPLSLFFSRLRSLFLFCDTASASLPLKNTTYFGGSVVLSFLTAKSTLYLRATRSKDLILPSVTSIDETPTPSPTSFFTEVYHAFSVLSACGGSDTSALQPSRLWHPI